MAIGYIQQLLKREDRNSGSSDNEIYRGTGALPGFPKSMAVVFKLPPEDKASLIIGNELIGARLARICGLPAPVYKICCCQKSQLLRPIKVGEQQQYVVGVASIDVTPNRPEHTLDLPEAVEARILSWPKAPMLAAFDEWTNNIDRHHKNFVWRAANEPHIVDHGSIFGGVDWRVNSLALLAPLPCVDNKVASSVIAMQKSEQTAFIMRAAKQCVEGVDLDRLQLDDNERYWCDIDEHKWREIKNYLMVRKQLLSQLMFKQVTLNSLFNTSS